MNKKLNKNAGITLISLVITIIIMLILVGVSITLAVNGGLFEYAGNAVGETKNAIKNEQGLIDDIINDYIKPNTMKSYGDTETDKTTGMLKANAKYESDGLTAVIPEGFKVSEKEGETSIKNGLVIIDKGGNEFVWIPVKKAIITENEIETLKAKYEVTSNTDAVAKLANKEKIYPMAVEVTEQDSEGKNVTNYKGILYNFSGTDTLTVTVYDWTSTSSYREPASFSGKYDNTTNLGSDWNKETFQNAYDKMVESVAENGGFYVGRYEISSGRYSVNGDIIKYAQSQSGKTAMVSTTWYDMYKYESNYAKYNESLGVTSEMIWGSQWDQMMIFVNGKNDGVQTKFYVTTTANRKSDDRSKDTGANTADQVANIFDLEASRYEWTQEAYFTLYRIYRGGSYIYGNCASVRCDGDPTDDGALVSSRLALYIK